MENNKERTLGLQLEGKIIWDTEIKNTQISHFPEFYIMLKDGNKNCNSIRCGYKCERQL